MGRYLLWRFRRGKPVRAGPVWNGLEAGMDVLSRLLAA